MLFAPASEKNLCAQPLTVILNSEDVFDMFLRKHLSVAAGNDVNENQSIKDKQRAARSYKTVSSQGQQQSC